MAGRRASVMNGRGVRSVANLMPLEEAAVAGVTGVTGLLLATQTGDVEHVPALQAVAPVGLAVPASGLASRSALGTALNHGL
mmetsp:Transcript_33952/g.83916  ORF Transcript_33952/g.83916 Transcript_33952/m.83916 type:complete len:82 (-) Transcript_33952:1114-1359(-)